jgi:uncharacterized protein
VLFFRPIIPVLEKRGYTVLITARDAYQVTEVADMFKIQYVKIGKHYGKNKLMKVVGMFIRAFQLIPIAAFNRPSLAVAHGSRSQTVAARVLFIKSLIIFDYEHSASFFFTEPTWALAPEVIVREISSEKLRKRIFSYPGMKEDVYVPFFKPDIDLRKELGIPDSRILVLVRPPAAEAHYHNPEAEIILDKLIPYIDAHDAIGVIVPRNHRQQESIEQKYRETIKRGNIILPEKVYDGLLMIWYSDLVVSGGGTMNREAAALGVPVYSIFRGKTGAVDRYLSSTGKLVMIEKPDDVASKIKLVRRTKTTVSISNDNTTFNAVVGIITKLAGHK